MCYIKIGSIVDYVDIKKKVLLKLKKYSSDSQHMANQDWIKYRALSRNGDKHCLQECEMLKRQYSTMPYQDTRLSEAKPCAWGMKQEPIFFFCPMHVWTVSTVLSCAASSMWGPAPSQHAAMPPKTENSRILAQQLPHGLSVWPRAAKPATPTHHLHEYMHGSGQFGTVVRSNP
jgi:hypothetical protein